MNNYCKYENIDENIQNLEHIKAIFKKYLDGKYDIEDLIGTLEPQVYPDEIDDEYYDLINDIDRIIYRSDEYEQVLKLSKKFDSIVEEYIKKYHS